MDWHAIRHINGSIQNGFEEFVSQLAKRETVPSDARFIRNGTPDAGCECYWVFTDNTEWAWQAKYFTESLGETQFQQIAASIYTAITKHPNIVKYFIAIPIDPPDGRIKHKKSMRDKWNEHLKIWQTEYPQVEFVVWWSSDMISILQRSENINFFNFWFGKESFNSEWFNRKVQSSIIDLGVRYTPEINIELDICKIFDGIAADDRLKNQYASKLDEFLKKIAKLPFRDVEFKITIDAIKHLSTLLKKNFLNSSEKLDFQYIKEILEKIEQHIISIYKQIEWQKKEETEKKEDYNIVITEDKYLNHTFYDVRQHFYDFKDFIYSEVVQLYDNPYLLIHGDAGSGKSHLLADIVNNRAKEGKLSLLFLGQKFKDCRNPRIQMLEELDLKCSFEDLLTALDCIAEINKSRIIIFIDAINEGEGKSIWIDNLKSLITEIKGYKNLGLVLSLRTTYLKLFNDCIDGLIKYKHEGFSDDVYTAIQTFFSYYKIEMPKIPMLYSEFSNPLFLMLFCKGLKNKGLQSIPNGSQGISHVFDNFISAIDSKILGENLSIKFTQKVIDAIINYEIENNSCSVPYEEAAEIILKIQNRFIGQSKNLLNDLISEGLLIKDCNYKGEEFIDISYERLKDYLIALCIIRGNVNINRKILKKLLRNPLYYQGIMDMLAILLPEKQNKEIFEILKNKRIEYYVSEAFIKSFVWRKNTSLVKEKDIIDYINKVAILCHPDLFWEIVISCATDPSSFLNANRTHKVLIRCSMAVRDHFWLQTINKKYEYGASSVIRLLDWALHENNKLYIIDDSIELALIMIGWFLVSSNRSLRDRSTKALTNLLRCRPCLILNFLKKFENVNDPYVFERVYASTYGAVLYINNNKYLKDIALYVYNTIFDKKEIYPHILLRDYARGIIEYVFNKGVDLSGINLKNIRPPYKSDFPNIPCDKKIASYNINHADAMKDRKLYGAISILRSMQPEYNRNHQVNYYGDFGRYIFQSNFCNFYNDKKSKFDFIMDLHNIAIHRIFELGYSVDLHGQYDNNIQNDNNYCRSPSKKERIGKKYQWIAMHELLAQVSDKYKIKDETNWKKSEYKNFEGPWELHVRDIDPTNLGKIYKPQIHLSIKYDNWENSREKWLHDTKDLPNPQDTLLDASGEWVVLDGVYNWEEPKALGKERFDVPTKRLFYIVKSYFIKNEQYDVIMKWISKQDLKGNCLPEKGNSYQVFNKEYVWSPAYNFFHYKPYYEGEDKVDLIDKQEVDENEKDVLFEPHLLSYNNTSQKESINDSSDAEMFEKIDVKIHDKNERIKKIKNIKVGEVTFTISNTYIWEKDYDFTNDDNCMNIKKPSFDLFNYFGLNYKEYDNCLYSNDGSLVCFDKDGILYFKRDFILKFLKENNLYLMWKILGEKDIIDSYEMEKSKPCRQVISGVYSLDRNDSIIGDYHITTE